MERLTPAEIRSALFRQKSVLEEGDTHLFGAASFQHCSLWEFLPQIAAAVPESRLCTAQLFWALPYPSRNTKTPNSCRHRQSDATVECPFRPTTQNAVCLDGTPVGVPFFLNCQTFIEIHVDTDGIVHI